MIANASRPWFTPLPSPILLGVMATWIPLSVPVMAGIVASTVVYTGLSMLAESSDPN